MAERMKKVLRIEKVKTQLMVIERLRALKRLYSYRELSRRLSISEAILCRYVRGNLLPSYTLAKKLLEDIKKVQDIGLLIRSRVRVDEEGYIDLTDLICDPYILKMVADEAYMTYKDSGVTRILTAAVNGIPLATMVAYTFGVPLVIAKRSKDVGVMEFLEEAFIPESSPIQETYYVPKRTLTKEDRILIVDDLVRSGRTLKVLINLARKGHSEIVGIFIMIAVGKKWMKNVEEELSNKVKVLTYI